MDDDVLDVALAVHREPSRRFAVRERPLSAGIGAAIQLASAAQPMLREAALRLGEPENTVLEAVRFYLQQALFDPGTDAYRVLGLAPDAPHERVRQHYRWLQRWLHPDRHDEDWESLYAKRVNWAWQQLRTPECRDAYDACRAQTAGEPMPRKRTGQRVGVGTWRAVPTAPPPQSGPKRIVLALSLASLALLALAMVRLGVAPTDEATEPAAARALVPSEPPRPAIARPMPGIIVDDVAVASPRALRATSVHDGGVPASVAGAPSTRAAPPARAVATAVPGRPADADAFAVATAAARRPMAGDAPLASGAAAENASVAAAASEANDATLSRETGSTVGSVAPVDALSRIESADERVQEICRYFSQPDSLPPPLWNDLDTQLYAERVRESLHRRNSERDDARFDIEAPDWRLSNDAAALSAAYRLRSGRSIRESGLLSLSMVWRAQMWLVTRVELRPDS